MESAAISAISLPRPPGPPALAVIRSFATLAHDPLEVVRTMARRYGPVVLVPIGKERLVLVTDPALIQAVLHDHANSLHKDAVTGKLTETLGNGLLTSEGAFWKRQRRLMAPSFSRKQLAGYAGAMVERAERATAGLQDGAELDIHAAMMGLTLDIICATVFGAELDTDTRQVSHAIDAMMDEFEKELRTWRRFVPHNWLRGARARTRQARATLDGVIYRFLAQKRADLAAGRPGDDLLSRLLQARDEDGAAMDDIQLRDEAVTMFVAGHETTALVLTWTAKLLSENPAKLARLQAEVDDVLLNKRRALLEDTTRLPYCAAVIKEAMRLYPPAYIIGRQTLEPMTLGGFRILPGDQILLSQWTMHRSETWFERPDAFVPERWLDGLEERLPKGVYFPFGGGARVCIGSHFAMMEAVLCLATLARDVELHAVPGQKLALSPAVTLRPRGGWRMRVVRRAI